MKKKNNSISRFHSLSLQKFVFSYEQVLKVSQIKQWFGRRAKKMPVKLRKHYEKKEGHVSEDEDDNKDYEVSLAYNNRFFSSTQNFVTSNSFTRF